MKFLTNLQKEADEVFANVITEVFQKDGTQPEFTYKDAVVMGLLENLLNHSKSMTILMKNSHHVSLDAILRTFFENYVYVKYILENDTEKKAVSYMYSNRISEFQLVDKLMEQSLKGRKLRDMLRISLEQIKDTYQSKTDPVRREQIESWYLNEVGMRRLEQKWYNIDGETRNFKALCSKMKLDAEYEFMYSILSTEVHGKDAVNNLDFQKYFVSVKQPNNKDTELHLAFTALYLMEIVRLIYAHYGMKKKLKQFNSMINIHYRLR